MKNHQYLTSGILESYLLGLVSDTDKEEVEYLLKTDPDVSAQLDELELDMEDYFLRNAVTPPPTVKAGILQHLSETGIQKRDTDAHDRFAHQPPSPEPARSGYVDVEVDNTHIRVHKYWRTAFIAVFILSKVFLILGLYYYFKADSLAQEVSRLKAASQQVAPIP